jgi:hypothetical protein
MLLHLGEAGKRKKIKELIKKIKYSQFYKNAFHRRVYERRGDL